MLLFVHAIMVCCNVTVCYIDLVIFVSVVWIFFFKVSWRRINVQTPPKFILNLFREMVTILALPYSFMSTTTHYIFVLAQNKAYWYLMKEEFEQNHTACTPNLPFFRH